MTELLPRAFAALGSAPTARELALVADTLVEAGEVSALEAAADDTEAFGALARVAIAAGSSGFVALDLVTQVTTGESARTQPLRTSQMMSASSSLLEQPCE